METTLTHCRHVDLHECKYLDSCPRHVAAEDKFADPAEVLTQCIWGVSCMWREL